jgi:hypothetical protein
MNTFEANTARVDAMSGGLYDCAIVADITTYLKAADLVVCKSTLEHVRNTGAALPHRHDCSTRAILFSCSCRRDAVYARLQVLLPAASGSRVIGDAACPGGGIYTCPATCWRSPRTESAIRHMCGESGSRVQHETDGRLVSA